MPRPHMDQYFTPLPDANVPEAHQRTLGAYRRLAIEHGVPEHRAPVAYRVRAGFTTKLHAPKAGPSHGSFAYLQGWNFPDDPTEGGLVFWVPRLLEGSTLKTKDQQIALLAEKRTQLELPAHHLAGFGNVALVTGLILAHFRVTGIEHVPLHKYVVRTDTCNTDGHRLCLYWGADGTLVCDHYQHGDDARSFSGAFALGVEPWA